MFFPISPDDLPDGFMDALREQAEQTEMSTEDFHNSVYHLFDELKPDQLVTLNKMLHIIASGSRSMLAAFYEGQVQSVLKYKHNVCPVHGVDHSQDALEDLQKADTPLEIDREAAMIEYGIESFVNPDTNLPMFRCINCKQGYPSLEDRMMKDPDDCPGCHQKAMWG
jgi:hypothetical protein